ncbi:MAG: 50S ribosomal protein L18 [Candidatus Cloacimonetes bacterium]|nr:50S ribosomal protein L18 [Candidatus Cloacimonadota bacterium]MBL7085530.1 50S ribosomal protein L18 [Candidatus Cloacimonadota bacterium]
MLRKNVEKNKLLRFRRKISIRKKLFGTAQVPRISVYRSLKHIYAQVINDTNSHTLISASTLDPEFAAQKKEGLKRIEEAFLVGKILAKKCLENKINSVCFDRNGFKYHGRVKALAEGTRKGGLKF